VAGKALGGRARVRALIYRKKGLNSDVIGRYKMGVVAMSNNPFVQPAAEYYPLSTFFSHVGVEYLYDILLVMS